MAHRQCMWLFLGIVGVVIVFLLWRIWHTLDAIGGSIIYAINEMAVRSGQLPIITDETLSDERSTSASRQDSPSA